MGRNYRLVVFDWDGTLLDSAGAIVACIQAAAADLGLPPPDDKTARQVIGLGLHDGRRGTGCQHAGNACATNKGTTFHRISCDR